ncbi:MAG TPA: hypothetical protein VFL80_11200 [Thermoanaerobaculia bacterium]|nr:hypothetical protein [Thermoanaerobaculia bacterium]
MAALLGMVIVIGLILLLVWRVYLHQSDTGPDGAPSLVAMDARPG